MRRIRDRVRMWQVWGWLSEFSFSVMAAAPRCYLDLSVAPFNWGLYFNRDLGVDLKVGPLRLDIMLAQLSSGWVPAMYLTKDFGENKGYNRFGVSLDCLGKSECPYMKRLILWMGPLGTLRLHKFYRSDQDEALHDHPWWFVTFPLRSYREWVPLPPGLLTKPELGGTLLSERGDRMLVDVKAFRPHFRPAEYRHAVVVDKPGFTIVLTGPRKRSWGFWVKSMFTHWREWTDTHGLPPCADRDEVAQARK